MEGIWGVIKNDIVAAIIFPEFLPDQSVFHIYLFIWDIANSFLEALTQRLMKWKLDCDKKKTKKLA